MRRSVAWRSMYGMPWLYLRHQRRQRQQWRLSAAKEISVGNESSIVAGEMTGVAYQHHLAAGNMAAINNLGNGVSSIFSIMAKQAALGSQRS